MCLITLHALEQGDALQRQPMDMEATQRCAFFTRQVAGALPAVSTQRFDRLCMVF